MGQDFNKKIMKKISTSNFSKILITPLSKSEENVKPISKEDLKAGLIYVPYISVPTKAIIDDKNGRTIVWQINRWQRVKLWLYKTTKLKFIMKNFN